MNNGEHTNNHHTEDTMNTITDTAAAALILGDDHDLCDAGECFGDDRCFAVDPGCNDEDF